MPDTANLDIYQGDDYGAAVECLLNDDQPADLTGYTAKAHIRRGPADRFPDVLVDIQTFIDGDTITLSIPAASTAILNGRFHWDLQLTAPAGTITTILAGAVIATAGVTRSINGKV